MPSTNIVSILEGQPWRRARLAAVGRLKALAPYALMELILPGGSLMALLLWLYRRRKNGLGVGGFPLGFVSCLRWSERIAGLLRSSRGLHRLGIHLIKGSHDSLQCGELDVGLCQADQH
jgi:hypothetical protein